MKIESFLMILAIAFIASLAIPLIAMLILIAWKAFFMVLSL